MVKGVPIIRETPTEPKARLGKGEKRGHKKEAIVTTVYTIAANLRTAEDVIASLCGQTQAKTLQKMASIKNNENIEFQSSS